MKLPNIRLAGVALIFRVTERILVTLASLAAIFFLYQWYQERDDRRLQRLSTFIQTIPICVDRRMKDLDDNLLEPLWVTIDTGERVNLALGYNDGFREMRFACDELTFEILSDDAALQLSRPIAFYANAFLQYLEQQEDSAENLEKP